MSDADRAAEVVELLATQYEGMQAAAKVLREIGSIDNHVAELQRLRDRLLKEIDAARQQMARDTETHQARLLDYQRANVKLEQDGDALIANAKAEAMTIHDEAMHKAEAMLKDTENAISAQKAEHAQEMAKLTLERDAQRERTRSSVEEAKKAESLREEAQAKLDSVRAAIAAIRG